jgi:hypothetical protein
MNDNPSERFGDFVEDVLKLNREKTVFGIPQDNLDDSRFGYFGIFEFYDDIKFQEVDGAFMIIVNLVRAESVSLVISEVIARFFIDGQSNDIYVDFVTYNGHADTFTYFQAEFQITPSGFVVPYLNTETMDIEPYKTTSDTVRGVFELVFIML